MQATRRDVVKKSLSQKVFFFAIFYSEFISFFIYFEKDFFHLLKLSIASFKSCNAPLMVSFWYPYCFPDSKHSSLIIAAERQPFAHPLFCASFIVFWYSVIILVSFVLSTAVVCFVDASRDSFGSFNSLQEFGSCFDFLDVKVLSNAGEKIVSTRQVPKHYLFEERKVWVMIVFGSISIPDFGFGSFTCDSPLGDVGNLDEVSRLNVE